MRWPLVIAVAALAAADVARAQSSRPAGAPYVPGFVISAGSNDGGRGQPPAVPMAVMLVAPSSALPSAAPPPAPESLPAPRSAQPRTPGNVPPLTTPPPAQVLPPAPAPIPPAATEAGEAGSISTAAPQMIGGFFAGSAALLRGLDPALRVPLFVRGPVAIGDNESPLPQDRVFATFNYFNNTSAYLPGALVNFNVYRETFGFEK